VLAALNAASRRLWRWPPASIDRRSARRFAEFRPGRRNGSQPNKETSLQLWPGHFAELDAHNYAGRNGASNKMARSGLGYADERRELPESGYCNGLIEIKPQLAVSADVRRAENRNGK